MAKKKVLILEDDVVFSKNLTTYLRMVDYDVEMAHTAKDALISVEKNVVNILLCDIRLPDIDGYVVMKKIHKTFPNIVIIIISATTDPISDEMFKEMGVFEFIHKPIIFDELTEVMKKAVPVK